MGSLVSCIELLFDAFDAGVAGLEPFRVAGSDICRSRLDSPKISPKLFLLVEVDVRAEVKVGVGRGSSLGTLRSELSVDDLPRKPTREARGEELVEALEPCRNSGTGEGEVRTGDAIGVRYSCASWLSVGCNRKACPGSAGITRRLPLRDVAGGSVACGSAGCDF